MNPDYLMYTASFLYISCYIPELYANYKNANANIYNIPEKIIMLIATTAGFTYAIIIEDTPLTINYGSILFLDIVALAMRVYYATINHQTIQQEDSI